MLKLPRVARSVLMSLTLASAALAPALAYAHDHHHRSHERAQARLEALLRDPPSSAEPFHSVGIQLLRAGDHDRAATAFAEAARRSTNPANAHYNRACALALKGARDEALAALRTAVDTGFDDADHMAEDEDLYALHGDPRFAALVEETGSLELPPVNPRRWFDAWPGYQRKSREAVERLGAYLASHPNSGPAAYGLGIAHLNLDQYEESSQAFRRALELDHRRAATLYNLACVEARRGRVDAAFGYLDRSLDAGFHEPGQLRSDDDLDNLRGDPRYRAAIHKADALARADGKHGFDAGWWGWWGDDDEDD